MSHFRVSDGLIIISCWPSDLERQTSPARADSALALPGRLWDSLISLWIVLFSSTFLLPSLVLSVHLCPPTHHHQHFCYASGPSVAQIPSQSPVFPDKKKKEKRPEKSHTADMMSSSHIWERRCCINYPFSTTIDFLWGWIVCEDPLGRKWAKNGISLCRYTKLHLSERFFSWTKQRL